MLGATGPWSGLRQRDVRTEYGARSTSHMCTSASPRPADPRKIPPPLPPLPLIGHVWLAVDHCWPSRPHWPTSLHYNVRNTTTATACTVPLRSKYPVVYYHHHHRVLYYYHLSSAQSRALSLASPSPAALCGLAQLSSHPEPLPLFSAHSPSARWWRAT